jgi:hypothetical protein
VEDPILAEKKHPSEQQPQGRNAMAGSQRYIRYIVFAVVVRAVHV